MRCSRFTRKCGARRSSRARARRTSGAHGSGAGTHAKLKEAGWSYGVIGIEAKRSDIKIGPAISQCLDYGRSLFELAGGVRVWLDWVFLWPLDKQHEALASVMAQNRVGSRSGTTGLLDLFVGEGRVLQVGHDGSIDVGRGVTYGKRAGSR